MRMDAAKARQFPGLMVASMAMLAGVLVVQGLPALPAGDARWLLPAVLCCAALLCGVRPRWRWLGWLILGVAWALLRGSIGMDARLSRNLEGRDIDVSAQLSGLPDRSGDAVRFGLDIRSATLDGKPVSLRGEVRVAWYDAAAPLKSCERWHLRLRLKRPRSMLNPGGTDSERTALERGIVANGYVRNSPDNHREGRAMWCMDGLRAHLAAGIDARVPDHHDAALLRALALGDTRALDERDWQVARANGVSHLLAISGFHVGVAATFGVWAVLLLYTLWPRLALHVPRIQLQAGAALTTAVFYGVLAGLGLPTQRTLLMIAVVVLARCRRRPLRPSHGLALALLVLLLADPLAVLSAGFWLSFVGVAFLLLCLSTRWRGLRGFVHELASGQVVMTLALLPLSFWFFGQASLVGALSNLVAVPVVSLLIVPLVLLGVLALLLCTPLAAPVLWMAAIATHLQWLALAAVARWPAAQWYLPATQGWALALAMLGALWLLSPRGVPSRWFGALMFLPLLLPAQSPLPPAAFEAWVFDVGQGLSVAVRTRHHTLVYDTGARYPSGFDVGAAAVVPSLHALGVRRLDALVVSHADNDHAGGARAVLAAYPAALRLAGEPARMRMPMDACLAGQSWRWDRVTFRVLSPKPGHGEGNDRSCVILVDGGADRLLLTGDITRRIEPGVTAVMPAGGPVVLVVPHHGSKTSSSTGFLQALHPSMALVSAGWHNRFGHPYPAVVQRYAEAGVPLVNTATAGAISIHFPASGPAGIAREERHQRRRYWREK